MKQILAAIMIVNFSGSLGFAETGEPPQIPISNQKLNEFKKLGLCINLEGDHCALVDDNGSLNIYIKENPGTPASGPAFSTQPVIY